MTKASESGRLKESGGYVLARSLARDKDILPLGWGIPQVGYDLLWTRVMSDMTNSQPRLSGVFKVLMTDLGPLEEEARCISIFRFLWSVVLFWTQKQIIFRCIITYQASFNDKLCQGPPKGLVKKETFGW